MVQVEMPSLAAGIATTRQADIMVGAHGANIANSWLLRPGSSVIELTMYEFELNTAHNNLARRNWLVSGDCCRCCGSWGCVGLAAEGGAALPVGCCMAGRPCAHSPNLPPLPLPPLCRMWPRRCSSGSCCCATPPSTPLAPVRQKKLPGPRLMILAGPSSATSVCGEWLSG